MTPPPPPSNLFDLLWSPLAAGMGARIGLVGDSGCGKTFMARVLLREWLRRVPRGFAFVHDDTGPPQFEGQHRGFVEDLKTQPVDATPRVVVFRGRNRRGVDPESLAKLAWRCADRQPPTATLLLLDELGRSANKGHWRHGPLCPVARGQGAALCTCELPGVFSWGRRSCVSALWTTQSPQTAPREAFEQSSALLCVHMGGRGLKYLRSLDYTDSGSELAITQQPDALAVAAGAIPGYVFLRRNMAWDRRIYKL